MSNNESRPLPMPKAGDREVSRAVPSPWVSIRAGERYCHVGDGVLRAAIRRGEVPAYKRPHGKGMVVNVHDLDEWVRSWEEAERAFA